jgi:hypothetical protein
MRLVGHRIAGTLLALACGLCGCQAKQMVNQYLSFDTVVTDLYEKHVLGNLARRDAGRTMVQIAYQSFTANLNVNTNYSGKVQFFANPQDTAGNTISLNAFREAFEPTVSNGTSSGLGITSAPAGDQESIRAMYDEQVRRPEAERIYSRTSRLLVAMRSCCYVRTAQGDLYYVPPEKQREFCEFVHKVSFYKAPPATQPVRTTQPAPAAAER